MGTLFEIVGWVKREGDVHAMGRLRLRVLAVTLKEGVSLSDVSADTECSPECLAKVRDAATQIVGKPCPV